MSLDTQIFVDAMKRSEHFNSSRNLRILNNALINADALIAGGGVLAPYIRNIASDLDIYVHISKAKQLVSDLERLNYRFNTNANYIAPAYDQSFFRKNNIIARFRLYAPFPIVFPPIDIMIIPDEIPLLSVVTNFDLTCCEIWYDGRTVSVVDPQGILNRTCELKKDYVEGFLLSINLFTIERVKKYIKKGFTITYDTERSSNTFNIQQKNVTSPEEWVIYKLYNWLVFGKYGGMSQPVKSFNLICDYPIGNYTLINLERILPYILPSSDNFSLGVTTNKMLYMKIFLVLSAGTRIYSDKYMGYINDILGISNQNLIDYAATLPIPPPPPLSLSLPLLQIPPPLTPPYDYYPYQFQFEETDDIDERDINIEGQTCRDVILNDDMQIQQYLADGDTFLLIHKSSTDDILCYEKSYIETILSDKGNWFYECIGDLLHNGNRVMNFGNENDAYIKLPLYKDGLNGFIHLSQMRRLLQSDNRIYYVYPDNDKDITHSAAWVNVFGTNPNWVSANHCQVGSKLLVYKLKICTDPERCLRSLAYIGGE